ncbi:MAG: hypothetical protein HY226_02050 [Candidatus Vogelbacteria bacterium]|nr:hypothetical protein [Candidatus Vogelbacteria bacterium]
MVNSKINPVLESTEFVVKNAKDVKINSSRIKDVAKEWVRQDINFPKWPQDMHLESDDVRKKLDYLILLDGLNFCFWQKNYKDKWRVKYGDKEYNGYFSLSLALKIFFENNLDKTNYKYLSTISFLDFKKILDGEGTLLLMRERWLTLKALSCMMIKKYDGDSLKFVSLAKSKFANIVPMIADLPSFGDTTKYKSKKIYIWKRAQILACDIYGAFAGKGPGRFTDKEYLTAFADYKVPQILHTLGLIEYSDRLTSKIRVLTEIKAGSREEIEIRAATIWAVEYLRREMKKLGKNMFAFEIDWILWNNAKNEDMALPYHHTKTVFY